MKSYFLGFRCSVKVGIFVASPKKLNFKVFSRLLSYFLSPTIATIAVGCSSKNAGVLTCFKSWQFHMHIELWRGQLTQNMGDLSWGKGTQSNTLCSGFYHNPLKGFWHFSHWYLCKNRYRVCRVWKYYHSNSGTRTGCWSINAGV